MAAVLHRTQAATSALPAAPGGAPATLRRRSDFVRVQTQGRSLRGGLMCLAIGASSAGTPLRVGYTVSRRVGNAVVRNRVRRRLREIMRHVGPLPPGGQDLVWIAYAGAATASSAALAAEVRALLARAARSPACLPPGSSPR